MFTLTETDGFKNLSSELVEEFKESGKTFFFGGRLCNKYTDTKLHLFQMYMHPTALYITTTRGNFLWETNAPSALKPTTSMEDAVFEETQTLLFQ